MNSPFANLFLAIQARVQGNVPAITYIDQDLNQLGNKTRPPVSWPCLLIDFDNFRFKDLGENVQQAKGTIVLRLAFAPHSSSTAASPQNIRELALAYFDIEWALHRCLQGWSPAGNEYGHLYRGSAITQPRTDGYRVRELRYKIAFDDYSTKHHQLTAPASLLVHEAITI